MDEDLLYISPFLAVLAFMAIRLFWPKRGVENIYRNWFRLQVLVIIAVLLGSTAAVVLVGNTWFLADEYDDLFIVAIVMTIFLGFAFMAFYARTVLAPTIHGTRWLRKRFPAVAQAIERYKQKGDLLEDYFPALVLDGKTYFLVSYHDRKDTDRLRGMLLFDEEGRVVPDEALAQRAAKCHTLAVRTVHYNYHAQNAAEIRDFRKGFKSLRKIFGILRNHRHTITKLYPQAARDLERVLAAEKPCKSSCEMPSTTACATPSGPRTTACAASPPCAKKNSSPSSSNCAKTAANCSPRPPT